MQTGDFSFAKNKHEQQRTLSQQDIVWMAKAFRQTYDNLRKEFGHFMSSRDLVKCGLFPSIAAVRMAHNKRQIMPPVIVRRIMVFPTEGVIEYMKRFGEDRLYVDARKKNDL